MWYGASHRYECLFLVICIISVKIKLIFMLAMPLSVSIYQIESEDRVTSFGCKMGIILSTYSQVAMYIYILYRQAICQHHKTLDLIF